MMVLLKRHSLKQPKVLHYFTLVELMVVIGIISVLAGMLLPALTHATDLAKLVACKSQLRQIGIGNQQYVDDFNGFLPPIINPSSVEVAATWQFQKGYQALGTLAQEGYLNWELILRCPGRAKRGVTTVQGQYWGSSVYSASWGPVPHGGSSVGDIARNRAIKLDYYMNRWYKTSPYNGSGIRADLNKFPRRILYRDNAEYTSGASFLATDPPHRGDSNYVWIDGSVHTLKKVWGGFILNVAVPQSWMGINVEKRHSRIADYGKPAISWAEFQFEYGRDPLVRSEMGCD